MMFKQIGHSDAMIRLSKKAWNNVLIFSVLFMILLFNSTNNILTSSDEEAPWVPLIAPDQIIMTIEYGQTKLERIGQGWRLNPPRVDVQDELAEIIAHWRSARLLEETGNPTTAPIVVVVWLAGQSQGRVYQFFPGPPGEVRVMIDNQLYHLQDRSLAELVPPGV